MTPEGPKKLVLDASAVPQHPDGYPETQLTDEHTIDVPRRTAEIFEDITPENESGAEGGALTQQALNTVTAETVETTDMTTADARMFAGSPAALKSFDDARNALLIGLQDEGQKLIAVAENLDKKAGSRDLLAEFNKVKADLKRAETEAKLPLNKKNSDKFSTQIAELNKRKNELQAELRKNPSAATKANSNQAAVITESQGPEPTEQVVEGSLATTLGNLDTKPVAEAGVSVSGETSSVMPEAAIKTPEQEPVVAATPTENLVREKSKKLSKAEKKAEQIAMENKVILGEHAATEEARSEFVKPVSERSRNLETVTRPAYRKSKVEPVIITPETVAAAAAADSSLEVVAKGPESKDLDFATAPDAVGIGEAPVASAAEIAPSPDIPVIETARLANTGGYVEQQPGSDIASALNSGEVTGYGFEAGTAHDERTPAEEVGAAVVEGDVTTDAETAPAGDEVVTEPEAAPVEAPRAETRRRKKKVEAPEAEVENPHLDAAKAEEYLLKKHGIMPDSTYADLRTRLPKAFQGIINRFEAKSEAKNVDKLYARLANITAQKVGVEGEIERIKKSITLEEENLIRIEKDPKIASEKKVEVAERLKEITQNLNDELEAAQQRLDRHNQAFDSSRAEMNVYVKRRDEAAFRVEGKLQEKIAPHEQKVEELTNEKEKFEKEIENFTVKNRALREKLALYAGKLAGSRGIRTHFSLKGVLKDIEKQIDKNEKLINSKLRVVAKLERKLLPLEGNIAVWKDEKDTFEALRSDKTEKYEEREQEDDAEKVEKSKAEAVEAAEAETPAEDRETPIAESAPDASIDHDEAMPETKAEKAPQSFEQYVEGWNEYAEAKNFNDMKVDENDHETGVLAEVQKILKEKYTTINPGNIKPSEFEHFLLTYLTIKKRDADVEVELQEEVDRNPDLRVTPEVKKKFKEVWMNQWNAGWFASAFLGKMFTLRREERMALEKRVSENFGDFWADLTAE